MLRMLASVVLVLLCVVFVVEATDGFASVVLASAGCG